jgi:diadenosine tetraphosphate (Ap4A) HIT family hydrolase
VLFPKQDVKNIADLTPEDQPYVMGCLALAGALIRANKLESYRLHTNGPGFQEIAYLHFHIIGD